MVSFFNQIDQPVKKFELQSVVETAEEDFYHSGHCPAKNSGYFACCDFLL